MFCSVIWIWLARKLLVIGPASKYRYSSQPQADSFSFIQTVFSIGYLRNATSNWSYGRSHLHSFRLCRNAREYLFLFSFVRHTSRGFLDRPDFGHRFWTGWLGASSPKGVGTLYIHARNCTLGWCEITSLSGSPSPF